MKANKGALIAETPKYLWLLILSYSMILAMSNWYDSRIVEIFGISVTPGSMVYSLTYLISNSITEVYGFKNARKAILIALVFNIIFLLYGWLVISLPTPTTISTNPLFGEFLLVNSRIIGASFVSYLISEPLNARIFSEMKIKLNDFFGLRFILPLLISGFVDSILFISIAFYNTIPNKDFFNLILHVWMIKSFVEILGLPLSIYITKKLKRIEELDIVDTNTNFTMFSLETNYTKLDNKYKSDNKI
ncbi:MAG: queuosine precursor transporter [Legionellales bacterium]|jgi:hypothetical protein|nr:queuosine precursor transporter [Legionellales bacterium]